MFDTVLETEIRLGPGRIPLQFRRAQDTDLTNGKTEKQAKISGKGMLVWMVQHSKEEKKTKTGVGTHQKARKPQVRQPGLLD